MTEFLYSNAPLVEVIAEVRWQLVPLAAITNAAIDPFFEPALKEFSRKAEAVGFGAVEIVVPTEVPRELLAGNVVNRFRRETGTWPVYQLGPGVFTTNIVPPYNGWTAFMPHLSKGIETLLQSYPSATHTLKVSQLVLRYLDAFTTAHGRENHFKFVREMLGVGLSSKPEFLKALNQSADEPSFASAEFHYPLEDGEFVLKVAPGMKENFEATILELAVIGDRKGASPDLSEMNAWFGKAHGILSTAFESTTSQPLKDLMGPKRAI